MTAPTLIVARCAAGVLVRCGCGVRVAPSDGTRCPDCREPRRCFKTWEPTAPLPARAVGR